VSGNRLIIVSNRLPITAELDKGGAVGLQMASGGLANGMRPWHEGSGGLWIGWPGDTSRFTEEQRSDLAGQLAERGIVPVTLSSDHVNRYYHGFANRVLWPLFHYLIDRLPVHASGWDAYRQVNQTFANVIVEQYRPGDVVWVHDYQLMLLPAMLRQRLPDARIGFFLHIPFPSFEVFRTLPWRREVLEGLLGSDLIGFHTFSYLRHFVASLPHVDGADADIDRVRIGGRTIRLGAFPMGIDTAAFVAHAQDPEVQARALTLKREAGGRKILLGVDRLDYTKGIPRRLQSIERLLTRYPDLRDEIRYIQVAVPSRGEVDSYQRFRRFVEEQVGRINGTCGTLRSTPIHYMHQSVSMRDLVAMYCAADVMLVTPLRDGMNLVAKEFLASRVDDDGVLVLSEFAGAAAELAEAVVVNPYDVDAVAETIRRALQMPREERHRRMRPMRRRVIEHDVHAWAKAFIGRLDSPAAKEARPAPVEPALAAAIGKARPASQVRLLLDYDGTLVPLAPSPELAIPDRELLELLNGLASEPRLRVEIVSGRPRETLERWFGALPVVLWAEHGFWRRQAPGAAWEAAAVVDSRWLDRVHPILERFTSSTPGSLIELKSASVAWHYRQVPREFGHRQAHELRMLLADALSNQPLEVLEGKKVIEVRFRGISKAVVARPVPGDVPLDAAVVAFGDDRTDEDLFVALPESSITVAVGQRLGGARYEVRDHRAVRRLLRELLTGAGAADRDFVATSESGARRPAE
jgi:trehalose 6-phosphate synthase/phosphatase